MASKLRVAQIRNLFTCLVSKSDNFILPSIVLSVCLLAYNIKIYNQWTLLAMSETSNELTIYIPKNDFLFKKVQKNYVLKKFTTVIKIRFLKRGMYILINDRFLSFRWHSTQFFEPLKYSHGYKKDWMKKSKKQLFSFLIFVIDKCWVNQPILLQCTVIGRVL